MADLSNSPSERRPNYTKFLTVHGGNPETYESIRQAIADPRYWKIEEAYFSQVIQLMEERSHAKFPAPQIISSAQRKELPAAQDKRQTRSTKVTTAHSPRRSSRIAGQVSKSNLQQRKKWRKLGLDTYMGKETQSTVFPQSYILHLVVVQSHFSDI